MKRVPDFNMRCSQIIRLLLKKRGSYISLSLDIQGPSIKFLNFYTQSK